ncbi:hypothetical protein CPB85DRAFT_1570524 [Mucidula mucida]|nr:hypothetical protein CPB85DRAFT_1570524 [Mucidula mucida]
MSSNACMQSSSTRIKHDGVVHLVTARADVLDAFSFPAVHTFALGDPDGKPTDASFHGHICVIIFKSTLNMLSESRCSLVSLVLSYTFLLIDEFLPILNVIPTLEFFDMRVRWTKGRARDELLFKFFAALGNRRNNSMFSLLPALQDLRLSIAAPDWLTHDAQDYSVHPHRRHSFRFVSQVFGAITERSKYPTVFRMSSFTLSTDCGGFVTVTILPHGVVCSG